MIIPSNQPPQPPLLSINHTNLGNDHRNPHHHTNDHDRRVILCEFPPPDLDPFLLEDVFPEEAGEGGGESVQGGKRGKWGCRMKRGGRLGLVVLALSEIIPDFKL